MQPVIIVIHLLIVIALVGVVLIQRSEGGGLGIGGGSGFMTARGTRNALTRLTAILAGCFFLTSIILTVLQTISNPTSSPDLLNRINNLGDEFGEGFGSTLGDGFATPPAQSNGAPDLATIPDSSAPVAPLATPSDAPSEQPADGAANPVPDR